MTADYVVVGSGLTGATIARLLADAGREVVVVERRPHVGGNVHDFVHESGVRIHTYGPHYFRTSSPRIWEYVTRFAPFYRFEAHVLTFVGGAYEHWPILESYLRRTIRGAWTPAFEGTPTNFEEASLAMMPRIIYEKFVKGYTEKQWGVAAASLGPELARRVAFRTDNDTRLVRHVHQGLPTGGYHHWMSRILAGIPTYTGVDYLRARTSWRHRRQLIYTGSLDELFDYRLGPLKYRRQRRQHVYYPHADRVLPCGQVNYPDAHAAPHVRLLEWKYMMAPVEAASARGTVVTSETPLTAQEPDTYEYPFPDAENRDRYQQYARLASAIPDLICCGRLGEYRYYDMDQAIGRAMVFAKALLREDAVPLVSRVSH